MKNVIILVVLLHFSLHGYSIFRPEDPLAPHLEVRNRGESVVYELWDEFSRIEHLKLIYDEQYFRERVLPASGVLNARHKPEQCIDLVDLDTQINQLVHEVLGGGEYTNFAVLKQKDFNRFSKTGLMVLEHKAFPLVVKLFIEDASSFVRPYGHGLEVACLYVSGGTTRHTEGFSRIKNLEAMKDWASGRSEWADKVVFPRKWFWLPKEPRWMDFTIYNIGKVGIQQSCLPAIYAVVCDKMTEDKTRTISKEDCMRFCRDLDYTMDPHVRNFFVEKETGKIAVIDTEYFPWLMGFRARIPSTDDYMIWYSNLALKVIHEKFCMSKSARRARQIDGFKCFYALY